ncbi:hypothetical protein [Streptomyces sp. cg35]|uniref:hypothetical protein n=1 Tax=Streptomyces sp. cg35 TaxID=3421650 RepID=UPI003D1839FE
MFLLPIPQAWTAVEHGWTAAHPGDAPSGIEVYVQGEVGAPDRSVLTIMRNPATGQRQAWFGPPPGAGIGEKAHQGVLYAMVGVTAEDWGPQDLPPAQRPA